MKIEESSIRSFAGKVAVITGGSSGIGLATATLLARKAMTVVIADLNPPPPDVTAQCKDIIFVETDVSKWDSQMNLFRKTMQTYKSIDVVFANAGITESEMALEDRCDSVTGEPIEPTWSTVTVNLKGLLITVKLALHYMRKQPEGGSIVMTGSRASYHAWATPVYAATKHGVLGLMRGLKLHTPQWKIRLNMVAPGVTHTNILPEGSAKEYEKLGLYVQTADDVARAVAFLAQEPSYNGKTISISQGVYREVEGPIESLKTQIWGEDDFEPSNKEEMDAFLGVQLNRF